MANQQRSKHSHSWSRLNSILSPRPDCPPSSRWKYSRLKDPTSTRPETISSGQASYSFSDAADLALLGRGTCAERRGALERLLPGSPHEKSQRIINGMPSEATKYISILHELLFGLGSLFADFFITSRRRHGRLIDSAPTRLKSTIGGDDSDPVSDSIDLALLSRGTRTEQREALERLLPGSPSEILQRMANGILSKAMKYLVILQKLLFELGSSLNMDSTRTRTINPRTSGTIKELDPKIAELPAVSESTFRDSREPGGI